MNNFDSMTDKNIKSIYKELWDYELPGEIIKSWWKNGKKSQDAKNSYQFLIEGVDYKNIKKTDEEKIYTSLSNIFHPISSDFKNQLHAACFGDGNEYEKIMRLHSSSLCALLIFCEVSENNPLPLTLNNQKYRFIKVLFEYKNMVITNPSNVDVVLIGKNETTNQNVILFLESKFTEYLTINNTFKKLGTYYLDKKTEIYKDAFVEKIGIEIIKKHGTPLKFKSKENGKTKEYYGLQTINKSKTYIDGLKQIISHYIGITNFISKPLYDERKDVFEKLNIKNAEIILGAILFDFNFKNAKECFEKYSDYYIKLAKQLNTLPDNILVLENLIKYSDIIADNNYKISDKVRDYYFNKSRTK